MPENLDDAAWDVRRFGIYFDFPPTRRDDKIEILHRNGAKQYLLPDHQRSDEATPVCKCYFNRTDIVTNVPLPIGGSYLALLNGLKA